jgi:hypothetical protein
MHPTIRDGEVITVKPLSLFDIKLSDIVFYQTDRGMIAHRVAKLSWQRPAGSHSAGSLSAPDRTRRIPDIVSVRGDGSDGTGESVSASRIFGRVVAIERNGATLHVNRRRLKMFTLLRWLFTYTRWTTFTY